MDEKSEENMRDDDQRLDIYIEKKMEIEID